MCVHQSGRVLYNWAESVCGKAQEEKKQERQRQGRDCVSVQMSMSMQCTICHMLKLKELTGYALNSGGGWTGDLTIADRHDMENYVAEEVHEKRFKSEEVGSMKLQDA